MPAEPALYPVALNVAGRPCLVIGGGPVAAGKVSRLTESGALVTVVAPEIIPALERLARDYPVTVHRRPYRPGEVAGYRLVVTATGRPEVDGAVADEAEAAGIWVNSADDPAHCSFHLPSVHRDGPVTIAVSTGGASPALARWLRRQIGQQLGPGLGGLALLLAEARRRLQATSRPTTSVDWPALLDGPLPQLVRAGRIEEARRLVEQATGLENQEPEAQG